MAASKPFWTLRVHEKRDVLVARHKARQVAHMLHFPPLQEACIAAGAFAIAAQARDYYEICDLCFQLEDHHLVIFARPLSSCESAPPEAKHAKAESGSSQPTTATRVEVNKSAPPMKLAKTLPAGASGYSADELAFLIGRINEQAPAEMFGELAKQNQEILMLLHLLSHPQEQLKQDSSSAA